jgi:surfactin synthase thioesterase subunit
LSVPAGILWAAPTIALLATKLLERFGADGTTVSSVGHEVDHQVVRHVAGAQARLICFHEAGGTPDVYFPFANLVGRKIEIHTISFPRDKSPTAETAARYLHEVSSLVTRLADRPYVMLGHSLGTVFAWRVTQAIVASGAPAPALFVPSALAPNVLRHFRPDAEMSPDQLLDSVFTNGAARRLMRARGHFVADVKLAVAMNPPADRVLEIPIAAFGGERDPFSRTQAIEGWRAHTTGAFSLTVLPGDHFYLADEALRRVFVAELRRRISALYLPQERTESNASSP